MTCRNDEMTCRKLPSRKGRRMDFSNSYIGSSSQLRRRRKEKERENAMPKFLVLIDANSLLRPHEPPFVTLDEAHRKGYIHSGTWIIVMDSQQQILLLKRGPELVTCQNSWGLLGEHFHRNEAVDDAVKRAIREELAEPVWDLQVKKIENVTSTQQPVYYYRDYGSSNDNRVDQQLTWVMLVQLEGNAKELKNVIRFDEEVEGWEWRNKSEITSWMKDSPDDFRHDTIRDL